MIEKLNKLGGCAVTELGPRAMFKGVIKFGDSLLKVTGRFEGRIESMGSLIVGPDALVCADIHVRSVVVEGTVRGDIVATDMIDISSTGKVIGNVSTARLKIADGVLLEGHYQMIPQPGAVDIFSAPASELKKIIHEKKQGEA